MAAQKNRAKNFQEGSSSYLVLLGELAVDASGLLPKELGYEVPAGIREPVTMTAALKVWMLPAMEESRF
jgi:hypothetical protein